MIVLDANVLIAHFAIADAHSERALEILDTEEDLSIHPVTLAETLVRPARDGRAEHTRGRIGAIGIAELAFATEDPLRAAQLRATSGLKLPDAFVLVAAERTGATLATFDARMAEVARGRGVEVVGVA